MVKFPHLIPPAFTLVNSLELKMRIRQNKQFIPGTTLAVYAVVYAENS